MNGFSEAFSAYSGKEKFTNTCTQDPQGNCVYEAFKGKTTNNRSSERFRMKTNSSNKKERFRMKKERFTDPCAETDGPRPAAGCSRERFTMLKKERFESNRNCPGVLVRRGGKLACGEPFTLKKERFYADPVTSKTGREVITERFQQCNGRIDVNNKCVDERFKMKKERFDLNESNANFLQQRLGVDEKNLDKALDLLNNWLTINNLNVTNLSCDEKRNIAQHLENNNIPMSWYKRGLVRACLDLL